MKSRNPQHEQQLERLTHQALRQLPPCPAPASLEARVLREIELRAARKQRSAGISRWPVPTRALLAAACALCVPLVWMLVARLRGHVTQALASSGVGHVVNGMSGASHTLIGFGELAARLAHAIPQEWLLGGLFIISAVYAALIALGYLLLYPILPHSKAHSV